MSEDMDKEMKPKQSVVDRVMDGIISDIIEGRLKPGDQLPTEMELCKQFSAGRNSVREAVKKLEANGVVYIRRADGTFVSETYNRKLLDPMLYSIILQKNSWRDFVELRSVIDIGTLNVIIEEMEPGEKFPVLRQILVKMEEEIYKENPSVDTIMDLDKQFHELIASKAHNPQLVTITEYITRLTIPSRKQTVCEVLKQGDKENFINLHKQMLEVVENRQKEKIVQTVLDHYVYWK
ncbi:FadR/GntR family transcriptional regulator [Anaeromicropila populeti]|uniref:DNA-binding transcriptional regulator, FadR family n=1 Tax=Anaeromicropila populeti TaxID=37658 RepID=A0A1I6K8J5_9FIRM|nr:GntR family transcriptional regulator [Anaeromicropila populeti]SFR87539.1 DNA-binding transcriptional regulator, FadR family [Anaeromicropila populeti]